MEVMEWRSRPLYAASRSGLDRDPDTADDCRVHSGYALGGFFLSVLPQDALDRYVLFSCLAHAFTRE